MIRIIDTYSSVHSLFANDRFSIIAWEGYINSIYEGSSTIFTNDLQDYVQSGGLSYETDILPIIQAVHKHPQAEVLHNSFCAVTEGLNEKVTALFSHELNIDVVLYLGLCNAAGWVTSINGRDVILLGIEKILELHWCDEDSMRSLIYHELGHAYHKQYGVFDQHIKQNSQRFVWQLFTEGIAMYFEQALMGNFLYYHQDRNGWLAWCDRHLPQIALDFHKDLPTMTRSNQVYFGDWVSYQGMGDVGYYLGAKFIHRLLEMYDFNQLINLKINDVFREYLSFIESIQ